MQQIYELARIVMPTAEYSNFQDLFINKEEKTIYIDKTLQNVNVYHFNTWMNMFAAKKHYRYCDLGKLYLKLDIEGSYQITVTGSNRNTAFHRIDDILVEKECYNESVIEIPNAENYEGIYFSIYESVKDSFRFKKAAWCTDIKPTRENKLAVVSCTFKREDFVTKNIKKFEQFKIENPELKDKIYMFISDNGKTLPVSLNSDNVTIYQNMNAGGAGGFARGLLEVMKLKQGFTRVLFMDDDVEIFPESFYRTLILSNYLKDEFKDSFINGAMLDLYNKSHFFENLAIQDNLWVRAHHPEQALTYDNILNINDIPDSVFTNADFKADSAWWYHCFDISIAEQQGLPFPCFFRGDDVEWSWRNFGKHHISMNGICVWHSPFVWRVSKAADSYYLPRNMFFLNAKYTHNFKNKFKNMFENTFKRLINTYDWCSLDLLLKAMKDILKGAVVFSENPEKQFMEINNIAKNSQTEICNNVCELDNARFHQVHAKKWRKLIWKLTKNGLYCPKFLFKKQGVALDWYPPVEDFILVREVRVYNLLTKKCEIRKFDKKKIISYRNEFFTLLNEMENKYDDLQKDFCKSHEKLSTLEFWNEYLELK